MSRGANLGKDSPFVTIRPTHLSGYPYRGICRNRLRQSASSSTRSPLLLDVFSLSVLLSSIHLLSPTRKVPRGSPPNHMHAQGRHCCWGCAPVLKAMECCLCSAVSRKQCCKGGVVRMLQVEQGWGCYAMAYRCFEIGCDLLQGEDAFCASKGRRGFRCGATEAARSPGCCRPSRRHVVRLGGADHRCWMAGTGVTDVRYNR